MNQRNQGCAGMRAQKKPKKIKEERILDFQDHELGDKTDKDKSKKRKF